MEQIEEARNEQQRALRDERALCSKKRSQVRSYLDLLYPSHELRIPY